MNILYLGPTSRLTTSGHRFHALQRLGHTVVGITVSSGFAFTKLESKFHYASGYRFLQKTVFDELRNAFLGLSHAVDLIWIDGGEYYGPRILSWLTDKFQAPICLYNVDDPTGPRDACRFHTLKKSLASYSLCVFVRQETSLEALALGAKKVVTVSRSFDECAHLESGLNTCVNEDSNTLSFVGTNISGEKRDILLNNLIRSGVRLKVAGKFFDKSPYWTTIQPYCVGQAVTGDDYVHIIQSSMACLGLLSHQNRDLITTRSLEIPACLGILCAELSSEHQLLYEDQIEAVFWNHPSDIQLTIRRLQNPEFRSSVKAASRARVVEIGCGNEDVCRYILSIV